IIVASPPATIMPLPVVITEGGIPRAAKRVAAPVVSDLRVASTIIGGVLCPINGEVSVTIHRLVISRTKLGRVAITIDVGISVPILREISFAIDLQIPVAINRNVTLPPE